MLKKIKAFFAHRWFLIAIGLLCFSLVIHLVGPVIAFGDKVPWASSFNRWMTILFVSSLFIIWELIRFFRRNKAEKNMVESLVDTQSVGDTVDKKELDILQARFKDAVGFLRKSSGNRFIPTNLYDLPWYIIIGPPGSGKTTALKNAGLHFPLNDIPDSEDVKIRGVGGTRNCDWWFTDQAVLIDTAGRYVTQDSDEGKDRRAWLNFLTLLKKYRKRQPINGAFVAISISDLLQQTPQSRQQHVDAIRHRLHELGEQLGSKFPVYVLFTKCDLISGFNEYFESLNKKECEQVWGMTFPIQGEIDPQACLENFNGEFDFLARRLNEGLAMRLHSEIDPERAAVISGFPSQFIMLRSLIDQFMGDVFRTTKYEDSSFLRGIYFTSGTQEGTPIDRLVNSMVQSAGLVRRPLSGIGANGKSFFIHDLLEKQVFGESHIARTDLKYEKKLTWLRRAGFTVFGALSLALLTGWLFSYQYIDALTAKLSERVDSALVHINEISPHDMDPLSALSANSAVGELSPLISSDNDEPAIFGSLGLDQKPKLTQLSDGAYQRVLKKTLLTRLMVRLENVLADDKRSLAYRYAALRVYMMLGSEEYYISSDVIAFMRFDWLDVQNYVLDQEEYTLAGEHLNALFSERPSPLPMPLDHDLIQRTQKVVATVSLPDRIMGRLEQSDLDDLPPFSLANLVSEGELEFLFTRKSDASLTEIIPALYTKAGYAQVTQSKVAALADEALRELWVFGEFKPTTGYKDRDGAINTVINQYERNYIDKYRFLLKDLSLASFATYDEAARAFQLLSQTDSPLMRILQGVKQETQITLPVVGQLNKGVMSIARQRINRYLSPSVKEATRGVKFDPTVNLDPITRYFYMMHLYLEEKGGVSKSGLKLSKYYSDLYEFMSFLDTESYGTTIKPEDAKEGSTAIKAIRRGALEAPKLLVRPILLASASVSNSLAFGGVASHINETWRSQIYSYCASSIEGRYPLNKRADFEVQLEDFGYFFGYGGLMDNFFKQHLADYVDTSVSPWKIKEKRRESVFISDKALRAFEKADKIRKTFFKPGNSLPMARFSLSPRVMDAGVSRFTLNIEGSELFYEFGPQVKTALAWPGPRTEEGAYYEVQFQGGETVAYRESGQWALFRLLDRANIRKSGIPESFKLSFNANGYLIEYDLIAASTYNPFRLMTRMSFTCPRNL